MACTPKSSLDEMISEEFLAEDPLMFCNRLMHSELHVVVKPGTDPLSPVMIRQADSSLIYAAFSSEAALQSSTKADGSRMLTIKILGFGVMRMADENGAGLCLNITLPTELLFPAEFVAKALGSFPCSMSPEGEMLPVDISEMK